MAAFGMDMGAEEDIFLKQIIITGMRKYTEIWFAIKKTRLISKPLDGQF